MKRLLHQVGPVVTVLVSVAVNSSGQAAVLRKMLIRSNVTDAW